AGRAEGKARRRARRARPGQTRPAELDSPRRAVRLDEIGAQRRTGLEIRPLGLPRGRLIAVVACRRRRKRLRERVIERKAGRGERAQHSAACGMKRHDGLPACEPTPFCNLTRARIRRTSLARQRGGHLPGGPVPGGTGAALSPRPPPVTTFTPPAVRPPPPAAACLPPRAWRAQAFARRARAGPRWYWDRAADRRMDSCRSRLRDWPWRSRR